MKADELVTKCEERTGWKHILSHLHSFTDNFVDYKKIIADSKLEEGEIDKFIKVCDIKTERAKLLMNDIGTVIGIIITATTAIILSKTINEIVNEIYYKYVLLITFLILGLFFIVLRSHYRFHIHAWTVFKEGAILNKPS